MVAAAWQSQGGKKVKTRQPADPHGSLRAHKVRQLRHQRENPVARAGPGRTGKRPQISSTPKR
jgi:hypothetical protein